MQNKNRDNLNISAEFFNKCLSLSKADEFNLVLINNPGEIIYLAALKDDFETINKAPLHYIVSNENEFILKMYGIKNYTTIEFPTLTDKNIFPTIPLKAIPFTADRNNNKGYFNQCWRKNLGLTPCKNKLPQSFPKLTYQTSKKLRYIDKIENIVFIIPKENLNKDFWSIIINYNKRLGFSVIVDSEDDYYKRLEVITTKELELSNRDKTALGYYCRSVFSERCFLNDILCAKGKNMFCFYTGKNKQEYKGLTRLFDVLDSPCEILIKNYHLNCQNFEYNNLKLELENFLQSQKDKLSAYEMCTTLFKGNKRKSEYFKYLAGKIKSTYGLEETDEKILNKLTS